MWKLLPKFGVLVNTAQIKKNVWLVFQIIVVLGISDCQIELNMDGFRGGQGVRTPPPLQITKNIGFKWRFAGGPKMARFKCYLDPFSPHQKKETNKKRCQSWTPSCKAFWIREWLKLIYIKFYVYSKALFLGPFCSAKIVLKMYDLTEKLLRLFNKEV